MTRTTGHLFAGIDGFGLGLAAHGDAFRTAWTIEYADFPRSILQQREPDAEHLVDVLEVSNPPKVDVLTGGFPCQDLSLAGKGAGIRGRRSGLWGQYARIVGEVEPELVLIENVPALLHRGFELVVRDLVELGYRVEWDCLPAAAFGAPHLRDRVWIAAHRHDQPLIFGQPAALFPMLPEGAADLVGTDGDEGDGDATSWHRWPRAGWVDGDPELVMPLEPLARTSDVKAGRVLLPTPLAADGTRSNARNYGRNLTLRGAAATIWPTPNASDGVGGRNEVAALNRAEATGASIRSLERPSGAKASVSLRTAAEAARRGLWPTPKASPSGPDFARAGREGSGGDDLVTAVVRTLLPTPRASDGDARNRGDLIAHAKERANAHHPGPRTEGREQERRVGGLNPPWVEHIMGFPLGWTDPAVANDELLAAPWHLGEPAGIPRLIDAIPLRRERLTALGNALVPAAPAWLGARYLDAIDPRSRTR